MGATLYERQADGSLIKLSHFKGRASYLLGDDERQLLTPNQKTRLTLPQSHFVSRKIASGHRLVLKIGAIKSKVHQINYGGGGEVTAQGWRPTICRCS